MSKRTYFSRYESPNIVIVPTVSFSRTAKKSNTKIHDGGPTNKIAKKSGVKTSNEELENPPPVKNTHKVDTIEISSLLPNQVMGSSNKVIKFTRLKGRSLSMNNLSKVNYENEKSNESFTCKGVNKQADLCDKVHKRNISQSTSMNKHDLNYETHKNTSNDDKSKSQISKNIIGTKHSNTNGEINNNSDGDFSQNNKNKTTKYLSEVNAHDDIFTNKIPINPHAKKSQYVMKTYLKNTNLFKHQHHQSTNIINQSNSHQSTNFKQLDKSKHKEQKSKKANENKSRHKLDNESEYDKVICDDNISSNDCSIKNKAKMDVTKLYNRAKEKRILVTDKKSKNEKCISNTKIHKECSTSKHDNKTITKMNVFKNKLSDSNKNPKYNISKNASDSKNITQNIIYKSNSKSKLEYNFEKIKKVPMTTGNTQIDKHIETGPTNPNNLHNTKEINLIINLVVAKSGTISSTHNTSSAIKNDSKSPSVSSSEVSFLDDINIDEIVESLKPSKPSLDASKDMLGDLNSDHYNDVPIINLTDENDEKKNTVCNKNAELTGSSKLGDVLLSEENTMKSENDNTPSIRDKKHLLEPRAQICIINSSTVLPEEKVYDEKIVAKNNEAPIVVQDDNLVEVLSDCSTFILGALDHSDIEEIIEATENVQASKTFQNMKLLNSKNDDTIKCLKEQTRETSTSYDLIEAQLSRMFEVNTDSSDILDNGSNKTTEIKTENVETFNRASNREHKFKVLSNQNGYKECPQASTYKNEKCLPLKCTTNTTDTNQNKNTDTQSTKAHVTLDNPANAKSEIINLTVKHHPVSPEDNTFIKALQDRMVDYLKTPYTVTSFIHLGRYSKIFQCGDKDGSNYAIKILRNIRDRYFLGTKKENMLMSIQKEIPKEKLHCVYLLNSFSLYGHWCFLMEYYPKNLYEAMRERKKSFHIDKVQHLAKQLIVAVIVLRNKNIVHSEISPKHILINSTEDRLKLCGFDASYYIEDAVKAPNIGHKNYRAPETILGYSSGFSLDVWSTGLVMYEMATNYLLFPGFDNNDLLYKQMCTLGPVPYDMIQNSLYKEYHFYERTFMRRIGYKKRAIRFIKKIHKSKRIKRTIYDAYERDWKKDRTGQQQAEDMAKLASFLSLLEKMLVMYPKYRLSIEFVYANAFIYE